MTESQITNQISTNEDKIATLKQRNAHIQGSLITQYERSAIAWQNQANALDCSKGTAKKKAACSADKAWKESQAQANRNLSQQAKDEQILNNNLIKQLETENEELRDLRKSVSATSKEVSLILANQGLTKAGEEAKAEASAEAIKNEAQTLANAKAEAISKEGEATAETKKVQGWIFAAAGGVVLILLIIVLIKKFKKK